MSSNLTPTAQGIKHYLYIETKKQLYSYKIVLQLGLLELSLSCNSGISDTGRECF